MIGLSLSFCVENVLNGSMSASEVEKIYAGCKVTPTTLHHYSNVYWAAYSKTRIKKTLMDIFGTPEIWESTKLIIPTDKVPHIADTGHWVSNEEEIVWMNR
jgi:hypothetical protein